MTTHTTHYYCRVCNEKIDHSKITPLLFQPVGHIKVFLYVPIKYVYLSLYGRNRDWFVLKIMKNCALSGWILGIYSPGLHLIITHCRNKLTCYCAFGMVLLFAENQLKITYFWIQSNPAINKRKAHKPSLYSDVVWLSLHAQHKFHMDLD